MNNDFENRIKGLEHEILQLKTISKYVTMVSNHYGNLGEVTEGIYRVVFKPVESCFFFEYYLNKIFENEDRLELYVRTPDGNSQILEVHRISVSIPSSSLSAPLFYCANSEITSIEKIG